MMRIRSVLCAVAVCLIATQAAPASDSSGLDWNAWQGVPVFEGGRMKPLDSFAREAVLQICGREAPKLSLGPALPGVDVSSPDYAAARKLFDGARTRKFGASELLLSWMIQPDAWERVPLLLAEHRELRSEIIGVPLIDEEGHPLRYISPYQFEHSEGVQKWRQEIGRKMSEAEARGEEFAFKGTDEKAAELVRAYNRWRQLTFNPKWLGSSSSQFVQNLVEVKQTWESMQESLAQFRSGDAEPGPGKLIGQVETSLGGLLDLVQGNQMTQAKVEPLAAELRFASNDLALWFRQQNEKLAESPPAMETHKQKQVMAWVNALAARTNDLARLTVDLHTSVFDNGGSLLVVPAMNPHALEENRTPEANPQAWLSLNALFLGSKSSLRQYPPEAIDRVKLAFAGVASAYLNTGAADRAERFDAATAEFAAAVRALGEGIEPARAALPIHHMDESVLAQTAYPALGRTEVELHYNRFQPFLWSWIIALVAVVFFGLSFGLVRRPMFWAGLVALAGGLAMIVYGFGLRVYITGWAPVTNMFETVVFVALVVGALGLWFAIVPLIWGGVREAWRLTAAPMTWEQPSDADDSIFSRETQGIIRGVMLIPRVAMMAGVFFLLTQVRYGEGAGYSAIRLAPWVGETPSMPTANDLVTWLVGICLMVPAVWYVPRLALTGLMSLVTIPLSLAAGGRKQPMDQVLERKPFAIAGASVALVASLVAYYAPVFDKDIGPLRPVLRDNFWLTVHVLTITASYAAGALALGLGNAALFHYLFGRYRKPALPSAEAVAKGHRPAHDYVAPREAMHLREPAACASLATFTYKAMQVAVLLLAAGTITGALWADVAWGRFWGWDAKEVWALVSLLVYMVILHGRYAGLFGNFGLAAFSVVGATSILMAWYGVNFVLGTGLHSYGSGTGGLWAVLGFVGLNWIFLAASAVRYRIETHLAPEEPGDGYDDPSSAFGQAEGQAEEEVVAKA